MSRKKLKLILIHQLLILLTSLVYAEVLVDSQDTTPNIAKRFTLQDLLSAQGNQVSPASQQTAEDATPKTQTVDIATLLAAAQKNAAGQQSVASSPLVSNNKPIDIDVTPDKNGNIDLGNLPGLLQGGSPGNQDSSSQEKGLDLNELQSLISKQSGQQVANNQNVVKEEFQVGKEKLELEAAGKRATRYSLAKGPDGGLNLIPVVNGAPQVEGNKYQMLQPKVYEEKGSNRQQMQLTTLSQAMYSPFPSDQNTLHLHLKGKDGKDGKPGTKGSMGPLGPKGPAGSKGPKGDAGTCSSQINGLFECTPDELDSLSNRVDYLEKICHKVENSAKKHKIHSNSSKSVAKEEVKVQHKEEKKVDKEKEKEDSEPEKDSKVKVQEDAKTASVNKPSSKEEEEKGDYNIDYTGEKKHFTAVAPSDIREKLRAPVRKLFVDPATAELKSMIDVRAKLKMSELDLLDRIKQAQDGTMKTL